jgi:hypothetical protein
MPSVVSDDLINLTLTVSEYWRHPCQHAYLPFVKYKAPFVFLQHWNELPQTLRAFQRNHSKIASLQRALWPWYQHFMSNVSRQFEYSLQIHINLNKASPAAAAEDPLEPAQLQEVP